MCTNPFCLSKMHVHLMSLPASMSSTNWVRTYTHESLHSASTATMAMGNMLSFPSRPMTAKNWPPYMPFKKQPPNPTTCLQPYTKPCFCASSLIYNLLKTGVSCLLGLSTSSSSSSTIGLSNLITKQLFGLCYLIVSQ